MAMSRRVLGGILMVVLCGCGLDDQVPGWCVAPGSPTVALASGPDVPLTLQEVWRRGGLVEGEELGTPGEPAIDLDGRVAFFDRVIGEVVLIDADRRWHGAVMRYGEGPGEVGLPVSVQWATDGTLMVLDWGRRQISRVDVSSGQNYEGVGVPDRLFSWISAAGEAQQRWARLGPGGEVLLAPRRPSEVDGEFRVQIELYGPGESEPVTLVDQPLESLSEDWRVRAAPGVPIPLSAPGPAGVVALAGDIPNYRVSILGSDQSADVLVCRLVEGLPLTRAEVGDTIFPPEITGPGRDGRESLALALRSAEVPGPPAVIGRMFFGSTGRLWVQRERPDGFDFGTPLRGGLYDVFSSEGRYEGTVRAPAGATIFGESRAEVIGFAVGDFGETSIVGWKLIAP